MSIDGFVAADLTRVLSQLARLYGTLHDEVSLIFCGIGPPPIRLARIGLEHLRSLPDQFRV